MLDERVYSSDQWRKNSTLLFRLDQVHVAFRWQIWQNKAVISGEVRADQQGFHFTNSPRRPKATSCHKAGAKRSRKVRVVDVYWHQDWGSSWGQKWAHDGVEWRDLYRPERVRSVVRGDGNGYRCRWAATIMRRAIPEVYQGAPWGQCLAVPGLYWRTSSITEQWHQGRGTGKLSQWSHSEWSIYKIKPIRCLLSHPE